MTLAVLIPVGAVIANRSQPLLLSVLAAASVAAAGGLTWPRSLKLPAGGGARLCVAAAAYVVLGLLWSAAPGRSLLVLAEIAVPLAAGWLAVRLLPGTILRRREAIVAGGLVLASVLLVLDLASGLVVRSALGLRDDSFVLNRSVVTLLLLAWPSFALLVLRGREAAALGLLTVVAATVGIAESSAAVLGLVAGGVAFLLCRLVPRLTIGIAAAGALALLAIAPVTGLLWDVVLGSRFDAALQAAHAAERIAIWRAFALVVAERPWFGFGFGTSGVLQHLPEAAGLPAASAALLAHGHPHNAFLQIWVEMGAVGALVAAALIVELFRRIARLDAALRPHAVGLACCGFAIAAVSHGAWQAWWLASLAAAVAGLACVMREQAAAAAIPPEGVRS